MTATDFPEGGLGKKPRWKLESRSRVSRGDRPQAGTVVEIGKIVVGASTDYVKEQDVSVDDEKLLEVGVLRPKESISDVCLRIELMRKQQNEIMGVLDKREEIFTDIPGKTSIIEHKVHLIDNRPVITITFGYIKPKFKLCKIT